MTIHEFDAVASSPRHGFSSAEYGPFHPSLPGGRVMWPPVEFLASIADVTNEQHQNMADLVQPADFNAEVVVRFLRDNGINACVDEASGGLPLYGQGSARESHVRFACVCLRASISYAIEAAYWCIEAKR